MPFHIFSYYSTETRGNLTGFSDLFPSSWLGFFCLFYFVVWILVSSSSLCLFSHPFFLIYTCVWLVNHPCVFESVLSSVTPAWHIVASCVSCFCSLCPRVLLARGLLLFYWWHFFGLHFTLNFMDYSFWLHWSTLSAPLPAWVSCMWVPFWLSLTFSKVCITRCSCDL